MVDVESLKSQLKEETALIESLRKKLRQLPDGSLWVRNDGENLYYSIASRDPEGRRHEHYVPKTDIQTLSKYSEAMYFRKLIPVLETEVKAMRSFLRRYKPERKAAVWSSIPKGCETMVMNRFPSDEEICTEWESENYGKNTYPSDKEDLYTTTKGVAVRSRIELITAGVLDELGLHYRYECCLDLKTGTVYPDFTVIHPRTHELYYLEIFGMMDSPEYATHAFVKIQHYADSGLLPKLIPVFDSTDAPVSVTLIRKILNSYFPV